MWNQYTVLNEGNNESELELHECSLVHRHERLEIVIKTTGQIVSKSNSQSNVKNNTATLFCWWWCHEYLKNIYRNSSDGRVFPQEGIHNGWGRQNRDSFAVEDLMECACIMIGVAMCDNYTIDMTRGSITHTHTHTHNWVFSMCPGQCNQTPSRRVLHSIESKDGAGIGGWVDHISPTVDPQHKSSGGSGWIKSIRTSQERHAEYRRDEGALQHSIRGPHVAWVTNTRQRHCTGNYWQWAIGMAIMGNGKERQIGIEMAKRQTHSADGSLKSI